MAAQSPPQPHLSPRTAAALMQNVCETVPGWEYGALGSANAVRLAARALQPPAAEQALTRGMEQVMEQGARLALFAWQEDPLDVRLARMVQALQPHGTQGALAGRLALWSRAPAEAAARAAELDALEPDALCRTLLPLLRDPAHGGFWLEQGMHRLLHSAGAEAEDACRRLLDALPDNYEHMGGPASLSTPNGLAARLWAQWALTHLSPAAAEEALAAPMPGFELWRDLRRAHCLARLGQRREAVALLREVWAACPCHPNLVLTLHDLAFPPFCSAPAVAPHEPLPPLALYSWNKADVLAQTLHSLRATEGADAPVFVLDNGSTDGTADMLRALQEQWGHAEGARGRGLRVLTLPVNVGAPAARNWLLAQPELRQCGEAVFLDDDLLLEPGWLHALQRAARAFPQAAVLGCRIVDSPPPHAVQSGDYFLMPPDMGQRSFMDMEEHFFVHGGSMGSLDDQLTVYARPCLSVSGCCHWLRLDAAHGGAQDFDIRFTPSQFDDLERDIRLTLAGQEVVYTGHARIRHVQHSSLRQAVTRQRSAHIFGNRIKLEFLYSEAQARKAREAAMLRARTDLLRKISRISGMEPA